MNEFLPAEATFLRDLTVHTTRVAVGTWSSQLTALSRSPRGVTCAACDASHHAYDRPRLRHDKSFMQITYERREPSPKRDCNARGHPRTTRGRADGRTDYRGHYVLPVTKRHPPYRQESRAGSSTHRLRPRRGLAAVAAAGVPCACMVAHVPSSDALAAAR